MRKTLVIVGGAFNALFFVFHLFLEWRYHQLVELATAVRATLEAFAIGGTIMVGFMAFVSLAYPEELLTTKVGRSTIVVILLTYVLRAGEEFVLFPRAHWVIVLPCLAVAAVYLAALLVREPDRVGAAPAEHAPTTSNTH